MNMGMAALEYAEKMLRTSERNKRLAATVFCPACGQATEPSKRNPRILVCRNLECSAYAD